MELNIFNRYPQFQFVGAEKVQELLSIINKTALFVFNQLKALVERIYAHF